MMVDKPVTTVRICKTCEFLSIPIGVTQ